MRKIRQYLPWILLSSFLFSLHVSAQCSSCGIAAAGAAIPAPYTATAAVDTPVPATIAPPGTVAPAANTYESASRPITSDYAVRCPPCGFVRALPGPGYDYHGVLPYEAYLATTTGYCRGLLDGFYIGVGAGGGAIDFNLEINNVEPVIISGRNDKTYLLIRGQAGFAFTVNRFYLAIEGGYIYRSLTRSTEYMSSSFITIPEVIFDVDVFNITLTPCNVHFDINAQNAGTIDILPGFVMTPDSVIYGRVGVEVSRYHFVRHVCIPDFAVEFPIDPPIDFAIFNTDFRTTVREDETDLRAGVGVEFAPCRHVSLNFDYVHTFGRRINFRPVDDNIIIAQILGPPPFSPDTVIVLSDLVGNISINTERNDFIFSVNFHF